MKINRDRNEPLIVAALTAHGCLVQPLMQQRGAGVPDLLCATPGGKLFLVEVKNPHVPKLDQQLNSAQTAFHWSWRACPIFVVRHLTEIPDVIRAVG